MKLTKAIEILTKWKKPESVDEAEELVEAKQILIEAGKVLERGRLIGEHHDPDLLPGETK